MLSRLQELRREEETLLRVKAALHDQLRRLRVEELALQSMIRSSEENVPVPLSALAEDTQQTLGQMDNEAAINQTELHLSLQDDKEEEEEESDS
ncbi:snRNA-activating protein complex subunit 5 [Corvus cornix cornix]|nr:snRNA-activating protein complex subunit 5 [Corvus cornix cornix]XP_031978585.1 snRNA-activating protein complex subunit 5 [Corvus moneduloides]XP_048173353.1 snRNA-activating protein complex subunit 5 [Corvus hawaiiensis]NXD47849.1 SNPC5 protein [Corvus moneduloides]